jgi:hypothetical protein
VGDPPSGQILNALQQIFNLILDQMHAVASFQDIQAESNVAARTVQAAVEHSLARWQSFLGDLAEWWSRLMRHCLLLVARYYTEPRTMQIRGRMGWESIRDFKGAQLLGQTNVRVEPGSLEYLSRNQIMAKTQYYASMGWISGKQGMAAIEGGVVEKLTESYAQDVAKVNRIINRIRDGSVMDMPTRTEMVDDRRPAHRPRAAHPARGPDLDAQRLGLDPGLAGAARPLDEDAGLRAVGDRAPGARGGREADVVGAGQALDEEGDGEGAGAAGDGPEPWHGQRRRPAGSIDSTFTAQRGRHAGQRRQHAGHRTGAGAGQALT